MESKKYNCLILNYMNKIWLLALLFSGITLQSCNNDYDVSVTVTDEIINANYIGNGVEWDPYDEAESWGNPLSDDDWEELFNRLDYMRPAYVRCMINSPFRYYNPQTGQYDETRNFDSMKRMLDYCQQNDIMVVYGEYNPPTWDMKQDQEWIDMSVEYLDMLVNKKGYTCIKHFVIFNEPDGDWASTDGDFELWLSMLKRFHQKMSDYPTLLEKVSLAGPDVVADYKNPNSDYDTAGWLSKTVSEADSLIGLYDIHSYPGQQEVHDGSYSSILKEYRSLIPTGKQIILGEAGYKYWHEADSLLMSEYNRRVENHPFTKGSDCNMLVYDNFYGIDMPLFISEVMNSGFSGVAAWMLDDAMHSQGDSGKPEDIKIWGMWNILGKEVFGDETQEEIRPWYYTWSLMCRAFPKGCNVLKNDISDKNKGIFCVAAMSASRQISVAVINVAKESHNIYLKLPRNLNGASIYRYTESDGIPKDKNGIPLPYKKDMSNQDLAIELDGNSMVIVTEIN